MGHDWLNNTITQSYQSRDLMQGAVRPFVYSFSAFHRKYSCPQAQQEPSRNLVQHAAKTTRIHNTIERTTSSEQRKNFAACESIWIYDTRYRVIRNADKASRTSYITLRSGLVQQTVLHARLVYSLRRTNDFLEHQFRRRRRSVEKRATSDRSGRSGHPRGWRHDRRTALRFHVASITVTFVTGFAYGSFRRRLVENYSSVRTRSSRNERAICNRPSRAAGVIPVRVARGILVNTVCLFVV